MSEELQDVPDIEEQIIEQKDDVEEHHEEPKMFTQEALNAILKAERLKIENKLLRQQNAQPQQHVVTEGPPSRDQFETDEQWLDARDAYRDTKRDAEQERQKIDREAEKLYKKAEKIDGFDRDSFDSLPLSQIMAQTIMDSDVAPELMTFLSQNPDEADRILEFKPARQAAEIGKLELKIQSKIKTSNAPKPIPTVGGRVASNAVINEKTNQADFEKYLRQQGII